MAAPRSNPIPQLAAAVVTVQRVAQRPDTLRRAGPLAFICGALACRV